MREGEREERGCFTLDGSPPSVPETQSGIKCCLDWRVDKNSSLSDSTPTLSSSGGEVRRVGSLWRGRKRERGMNGVRTEERDGQK